MTPTTHVEPAPMTWQEERRIAAAVRMARTAYPGPVGDVLARELLAWQDFGYRLGVDRPVMRLVEHLLAQDTSSTVSGCSDCEATLWSCSELFTAQLYASDPGVSR